MAWGNAMEIGGVTSVVLNRPTVTSTDNAAELYQLGRSGKNTTPRPEPRTWTSAVLFSKWRPNWSVPLEVPNKRPLTSADLKVKVVSLGNEWQVSDRSKDSLDSFLLKRSHSRSAPPTYSHSLQSSTPTNKRRLWRTRTRHSGHKGGPPLMRGLGINKNIPISDTKLMLGFRVDFISFHSSVDSSKLTRQRSRVPWILAWCLWSKASLN